MNQNQTLTQKKNVNSTSNVTHRILSMDSNRMRLVFAQVIVLLFVASILIISSVPTYIFSYVDENGELMTNDLLAGFSGLFLIVSFFAVLPPLLHGYSRFSMKLSNGEHPVITEIFSPFLSVKKYFSSLGLCFVKLVRIFLIVIPTVGGISFLISHYSNLPEAIFIFFCILAAAYAGAYMSSFIFFAPYLILKEKNFLEAIKSSVRMSRETRAKVTAHTVSHTPSAFAGILSFGVLALIYTIPRISVSYYVFCNAELNSNQYSETNDTDDQRKDGDE